MNDIDAETAKKTSQKDVTGANNAQTSALDQRYHQIGISAVAAAVRYQGEAKNPAYAPAPTRYGYAGEVA
jgi:hypothetical protein